MKDEILSANGMISPGISSPEICVKHSMDNLTYLIDGEERRLNRMSIFVGSENAILEGDSIDAKFIGAQGTKFYLREGYCYDVDSAITFYEGFVEYLRGVKERND